MIYDVIIVGAGRAGIYTAINADKNLKKLILEKNKNPGVKVLLSGGERANLSNIDIEIERDYFGQNKKSLLSIFSKHNNYDVIDFFTSNGVSISEEDRGRLILSSGNSRELLDFILKKRLDNNTTLHTSKDVKSIEKILDIFEINTLEGNSYKAKKVVISTGGKSFFQVGTTGDGYDFAKNFGLNIITPYRGLCGLVTKKDLSTVSGVSRVVDIEIKVGNKSIYIEKGPILFTHFGISGPIVFNRAVAIGEYINKNKIVDELEFFKNNLIADISFDLENTPKSLIKFFDLNLENNITLDFQDYRSWKEAKVTGGGIDINELNKNLESKKVPGLYFCGEVIDITGKTGGFNLQWAWSSAYVVGKSL